MLTMIISKQIILIFKIWLEFRYFTSPKKRAFNLWSFRKCQYRRSSLASSNLQEDSSTEKIKLNKIRKTEKSKTFDELSSSTGNLSKRLFIIL